MKYTIDTEDIKIKTFNQMAQALERDDTDSVIAIITMAVDAIDMVQSLGKVAE